MSLYAKFVEKCAILHRLVVTAGATDSEVNLVSIYPYFVA
jgi:hypothetical protein